MWPQTVRPRRPPGASTRWISVTASGVVPHTPRKLVTTSNDSASHGSACMSPTRMSASGLRSRAIATSRGRRRCPRTRLPGVRRARWPARSRRRRRAVGRRHRPSAGGGGRRTRGSWRARTASRSRPPNVPSPRRRAAIGLASWTVMRISSFGVGSSGFPWSAEMLLEVGGEQLGVGPDTGEQV